MVKKEKIHDLRKHQNPSRALHDDIEPRYAISWRTRNHRLIQSEMTDGSGRAHEFINAHRNEDVIAAAILDYGAVVYLKDSAPTWPVGVVKGIFKRLAA